MEFIKKYAFGVGELAILLACLIWYGVSGHNLQSTLLNSVAITVLAGLVIKLINRKK